MLEPTVAQRKRKRLRRKPLVRLKTSRRSIGFTLTFVIFAQAAKLDYHEAAHAIGSSSFVAIVSCARSFINTFH